MRNTKKIALWEKNEYDYPLALGFVPNLLCYLHEDSAETRACILVVPGGGYCTVSPTEGEIVAKEFYARGFQAFVLTYTTNMLMSEPLKMQPLKDISRAVRCIRSRAEELAVDINRIVLCGGSAGAHLCASLCTHYKDIADENYALYSNRPDAALLSYPVITSGKYAHQDSFRALLGSRIYGEMEDTYDGIPGCKNGKEALYYMSIEQHIAEDMPPCFVWHTATDNVVSAYNSQLLAGELLKHKIPYACHIFSRGGHGLSLANEKWASGEFGDPYTLEQSWNIIRAVKSGEIKISEQEKEGYDIFLSIFEDNGNSVSVRPNEEVAMWQELAAIWMSSLWEAEV